MRAPMIAVAVALTFAAGGHAQQPVLIKDINATPLPGPSSDPGILSEPAPHIVFAATRADIGRELFVTRGTPATTSLLLDIRVGPVSSEPDGFVAVNGQHWFTADDGVHGRELWVTDGTPSGTVLAVDIVAGPAGARPTDLVAVGRTVYFRITSGTWSELWRSDGSAAATTRVAAFNGDVSALTAFLGGVLFVADDGRTGGELWISDGTPLGTHLIRDINPGPGYGTYDRPFVFGSRACFAGNEPATGSEPWITDGTAAGTRLIKDVRPGTAGSRPGGWLLLGAEVLFSAAGPAGRELYATDGTAAGTRLIKDIEPGPGDSSPYPLTRVGGRVFFGAATTAHGGDLWITDGTTNGTSMVIDLFRSPYSLTALGSTLFFTTTTAAEGDELWRSDGTAAGTRMVADLYPGRGDSAPRNLRADVANGRLLFAANDAQRGVEPWVSDGTAAGTLLLADLDARLITASSEPSGLVDGHGVLYFTADDGVHGRELWRSDGTSTGTILVKDVRPGADGIASTSPLWVDDTLYFAADDGVHGTELWRSDGSTAGSRLIADVLPGPASGGGLPRLGAAGGIYYFGSDATGPGLFRTDGTAAGTVRLAAGLRDAGFDRYWFDFHVLAGNTLFAAADGLYAPANLWRTDGTPAGTAMVADFGSVGSRVVALLGIHAGALYFSVARGSTAECWKSDGTPGGTLKLSDFAPDAASYPPQMVSLGNRAVYTADVNGIASLVSTDGTPSATYVIAAMAPRVNLFGVVLTAIDGHAVAMPYTTDWAELWSTDRGYHGYRLAVFPDGACLSGASGSRFAWFTTGRFPDLRIWRTDGTSGGTAPVIGTSNGLRTIAVSSGQMLFDGWTDETGYELFRFDPGATAQSLGQACGASLAGTDPVLGGNAALRVDVAQPNSVAVVLIGVLATLPAIVEPGCVLHFDPGAPHIAFGFALSGTTWNGQVTIPSTPSLTGAPIAVQCISAPGSTRLGLDLSNGLLWVPGH